MATAIDVDKKQVRLAKGDPLSFDRVIVAPGIDFIPGAIPALDSTPKGRRACCTPGRPARRPWRFAASSRTWPTAASTSSSIPEAPYRCPPGPYERACQVAAYFKAKKPKSKVLILDANADVTSKGPLFKKAWAELYGGIVEYRGNSKAVDVDLRAGAVKLEFGDVKGNVLNVLPPMKAGKIAEPFITANKRWCEVDWLTFESKAAKGVHVLGDSLQVAPLMPKSGHMANAQGKACAAAVVALLNGEAPNPSPRPSPTPATASFPARKSCTWPRSTSTTRPRAPSRRSRVPAACRRPGTSWRRATPSTGRATSGPTRSPEAPTREANGPPSGGPFAFAAAAPAPQGTEARYSDSALISSSVSFEAMACMIALSFVRSRLLKSLSCPSR